MLLLMRGVAEFTTLDAQLSNETLDHLPGLNVATNGEYAAELLANHDHLNIGMIYIFKNCRNASCNKCCFQLRRKRSCQFQYRAPPAGENKHAVLY